MYRILSLLFICQLISLNSGCQTKLTANLANAVSINYNNNLVGSGLIYEKDSLIYLITAAHVIFQVDTLDNITDNIRFDKIQIVSYSSNDYNVKKSVFEIKLHGNNSLKRHKRKDVCILKIGKIQKVISKISNYVYTHENVRIIESNGIVNAFNNDLITKFEHIEQGRDVRVIGYPKHLDFVKRNGLRLYEFEYPLLQSGVISGVSKSLGNIIVNAPIFYGNSGGAVLYKTEGVKSKNGKSIFYETYTLIGIATDFIPFILNINDRVDISNSGYSVVVPIHFAIEMLD